MTCSVPGCHLPCDYTNRGRKGWCNAHYLRWRRHGDPLAGKGSHRPKGLTEAESFKWFMPGEPPNKGCWDWSASTNQNGYGQFSMTINGSLTQIGAHLASYRIYRGVIPPGQWVLHDCDRKICVQPAHLHLGTSPDNIREAVERGLIQSKLARDQVQFIRTSHMAQSELADQFGVNQSTISRIITRKNWKHI